MTRSLRRVGIALLLVAGIINATTPPTSATHVPALLVDPPGRQSAPRTDGQTVVWLDYRDGDAGNADLYGARIADGQEFPIATDARDLA